MVYMRIAKIFWQPEVSTPRGVRCRIAADSSGRPLRAAQGSVVGGSNAVTAGIRMVEG